MPFVNFKLYPTNNVSSTATLAFGSQNACILDSIWVSNVSDSRVLVDLKILAERDNIATDYFFMKNHGVDSLTREEILKGSVLYMESGDLLYANSDFSGNTFDIFVSYRELTEA